MNPWQQIRHLGAERRRLLKTNFNGNAEAIQARWLMNCLERNAHCRWARKYRFEQLCSAKDYQQSVPLHHYDDLQESIACMARGERDVLFAGLPQMFELTSGSTGGSKLIPYGEHSLFDFQSALLTWLADLVDTYRLRGGSAYWSISPVNRAPSCTESGIPVGVTDAQYLGVEALDAFSRLSAVPFSVAGITDVEDWKVATLYYLLRARDLTLVSVWSPTFFQLLLNSIEDQHDRLEQLLASGGRVAGIDLPADGAALQRLLRYASMAGKKDTSLLWPNLRVISCWGDASSEPYFNELAQQCPQADLQRKGLLATEGVVTAPDSRGDTRLCLHSAFYEFLDRERQPLLAGEIEAGQSYEVVMTTAGGLYRYRTGDQVLCTGAAQDGHGPALRFLGRVSVTSDLVGEKLSETFVSDCLSELEGFRVLVPQRGSEPHYTILLDREASASARSITERVEQKLRDNPHYAYARRLGQLGTLQSRCLDKPLEHYMDWAASRGMRLGDIKPSPLRTEPEFAAYMGVAP